MKALPKFFYPETAEVTETGTLLSQDKVSIHILQQALESYVSNEHEIEDGRKHIDKYRDFSYAVAIKKGEETLLETTITKEDFQEHTGTEFLNIAHLYNYEFDRLSDGKLTFFGSIGVPETDQVFPFNHIFSLADKSFSFVEFGE